MTGFRITCGLAVACVLLSFAAVAQSASADTGQTIFECTEESLTTKTFSDAHCVNTTGTLKFGHVVLPEGQKIQAKVNNSFTADDTISATPFVAKIEHLHGFSNVTITCAEVTGSGKALNILDGSVHEATGTGEAFFRKGISENCTTNQTGCSAAVGLIKAQVEAVEGLAPGITGMGLRFKPLSPATSFGTVTFEGTCGLSAFGAIPIKGSTIATARGEATGRGATAYFLEGEMNSLTIGAEKAEITGRLVFTRTSTGWPLVLTTSPFAGDQ